jgi:UDP-N-acetylmuramate dehydrogenase
LGYLNKTHVAGLLRGIVGEKNIEIDAPMKHYTSFRIGGPADILVTPENDEQLSCILNICRNSGVPYFVMGNGSNLLVRDKGIRGVVIKLFNNYSRYKVEDDIIKADAGILLSKVSNIALNHGLSGLEFASGIPGTLGGAVFMNAGAYGGEMKDTVRKTEYMDQHGNIMCIYNDEHEFGYRTSFIQKTGGIILRSEIKLNKGLKGEIRARMDDFNAKRKEKQPVEMPSAGSVFKRPKGYFAGKLIQDSGLKGYRIGGAEVSQKHCGFIVNTANASSNDVVELIRFIQHKVKSESGVELHTEIRIVGEE